MPPRTNEFQKLVKVINHSLAPSDAKITESAMVYDFESETEREIDILIESTLLNCEIKIGIECTTKSRPLDVSQIESFKEKHRKTRINQTVIVSKFGFTSSAKKYAQKNSIRILTFNDAKSENWSKKYERLKNLKIHARTYCLHNIDLLVSKTNNKNFVFSPDVTVEIDGNFIPVGKFASDIFASSDVATLVHKELMDNEKTSTAPCVSVGFNLMEKYSFRDTNGIEVFPSEMTVVMTYKTNYNKVHSKQVNYDGEELVVADIINKQNEKLSNVAIREKEGVLTTNFEVYKNIFPG